MINLSLFLDMLGSVKIVSEFRLTPVKALLLLSVLTYILTVIVKIKRLMHEKQS